MVVQQWLDSLFYVHHTQQLATLFLVSSNDKANKNTNRRQSRFFYCWKMEWHSSHRWMWSTNHILLSNRTNHSWFRLMNVPTYDIPASPILLVGFAGIAVALFTLYTVNKAYYNSPFRGWYENHDPNPIDRYNCNGSFLFTNYFVQWRIFVNWNLFVI